MSHFKSFLALALTSAVTFSVGCSEKDVTVNTPTPNPNVTVSVSPETRSLGTGESMQFQAAVAGSSNSTVEWSVFSTAPSYGYITQGGLYTAPASITGDSIVVMVLATADANTERSDTARVVVHKK